MFLVLFRLFSFVLMAMAGLRRLRVARDNSTLMPLRWPAVVFVLAAAIGFAALWASAGGGDAVPASTDTAVATWIIAIIAWVALVYPGIGLSAFRRGWLPTQGTATAIDSALIVAVAAAMIWGTPEWQVLAPALAWFTTKVLDLTS